MENILRVFLLILCSSSHVFAASPEKWSLGTISYDADKQSYSWVVGEDTLFTSRVQKRPLGTVKHYISLKKSNGSSYKLGVLKFKFNKIEFTEYAFRPDEKNRLYHFYDEEYSWNVLKFRAQQDGVLKYSSQEPRWLEFEKMWVLNFENRASLASTRNAILRNEQSQKSAMRLGFIGESYYNLDYVPKEATKAFVLASALTIFKLRPKD